MPKVYRAMRADPQDPTKPEIAATARALGVRASDIPVDLHGNVSPHTGGMSVSPTWRDLPGFRIPRRLRPFCNKAAGPDDNHCWTIGSGTFQASALTADLDLRPDPLKSTHGFVEPSRRMSMATYGQALADTQGEWSVDET
jgi:hypothetical protein